jgi:hypothetical protein
MKTLGPAAIGLLIIVASLVGWRAIRIRASSHMPPPFDTQPASLRAHNTSQQPSSITTDLQNESSNQLGRFSIAGRDYIVELKTRKIRPGAKDSGDTVVAMDIRDETGAVQYQRVFPYVEGTADDSESWSVSAHLLTGTNGTGLLVSYDHYYEPSAPEEEPTGWIQIFGVVQGKFVPFDAPLEVQGGLLDEYVNGKAYKAARPLDSQMDIVEFKVWAGHCRLIYPVRADWSQGKLSPAQECTNSGEVLPTGCQYKVVAEDKLYREGITFVRLWPDPVEKAGQLVRAVVKKDSKVDLLTALVVTHWADGNRLGPTANSKAPMDDAGSFGVTRGGDVEPDLWLKVRIDGKEGWMHSEEDFRALGLPEDE